MSRGMQPYTDIEAADLITHFQNNHRLSQPNSCPDSLYEISFFRTTNFFYFFRCFRFKLMSACWITSIDQRPSMTSLLQPLIEFYGQLARFI